MEKKDIKIVFIGTGNFAVPVLDRLNKNYNVKLLVCSPDKPVGRKQVLAAPETKIYALQNSIPIEQPVKLKDNQEFFQKLKQIKPDVIVVVSYGKILPVNIINLPEHGCLNIHGSILPKYRGASPIQTALKNGDKESGVSIILMDQGMDTGDIVAEEEVKVEDSDDYLTLSDKLSKYAADLMDDILIEYVNGNVNLEVQDDDAAIYCSKITSEMGKIQWSRSAQSIANLIRALGSTEGVYCMYKDKRLYVEEVEVVKDDEAAKELSLGTVHRSSHNRKEFCVKCGKYCLKLKKVKLEGRNSVDMKDFINGHQDLIDSQLK